MTVTRRDALRMLAGSALLSRCATSESGGEGRLHVRPTNGPASAAGVHTLPLQRQALLYIPADLGAAPAPLALVLHGATGRPERFVNRLRPFADEFKVMLLAPKSAQQTWDAMSGSFGPDLEFIDSALRRAFHHCNADPRRLAVSGFSDGATLAIALGLANGDLFSRVAAFSPGFLIPVRRVGTARFFLSHGTHDPILPIDSGSRAIARILRQQRVDVQLREFDGEHTVPPEVAREAFAWLRA